MIKVLLPPMVPHLSHVPLLYPNLGVLNRPNWLYQNKILSQLRQPFVTITKNTKSADYIIVPHDYFHLKQNLEYHKQLRNLSQKYSKPLLVFYHSDDSLQVPLSRAVVFRTSQYRHQLRSGEIIMPPHINDVSQEVPLELRTKPQMPTVSFCGWTEPQTLKHQAYLEGAVAFWRVKAFITGDTSWLAHISGLKWRQQAVSYLARSKVITPAIIKRQSYSGYGNNNGKLQDHRQEFVTNLNHTDVALAVKGDGNYSQRFYEALSLGKIIALIDTDLLLPLEQVIPYDSFVVKIALSEIKNLDKKIASTFDSWDSHHYQENQKNARQAFEKYLRIDSFFDYYFRRKHVFKGI